MDSSEKQETLGHAAAKHLAIDEPAADRGDDDTGASRADVRSRLGPAVDGSSLERAVGGSRAAPVRPHAVAGSDDRAAVEERWRTAMVAAQSGDADAYRSLLTELLPVVRRLVRAKIRDPATAEDVAQNALLSIHRARHTYRSERPFGPWLRAVVRNASIDGLREIKRRSDREVAVEAVDWLADPRAAHGARDLERAELSPELAEALATLPEKQREAVVLIQLRGLTVAEAAARIGITPGALKVRAHRGYRALRARLQEAPR